MGISIWQLVIILLIVLLLFGAKRLRNVGSDLGSAVKEVIGNGRFFKAADPTRLADTWYYRALDGGHTWPGSNGSPIDPTEPIHTDTPATPLVFDFFDLQRGLGYADRCFGDGGERPHLCTLPLRQRSTARNDRGLLEHERDLSAPTRVRPPERRGRHDADGDHRCFP